MVKVNYIFRRSIIKSEEVNESSVGVLIPREGEFIKFNDGYSDKICYVVDAVLHSQEKSSVPGVPNYLIQEKQRVITLFLVESFTFGDRGKYLGDGPKLRSKYQF